MQNQSYSSFSNPNFGVYYDPFGMLMPNRHGNETSYKYGFNGMEKDDEIKSESGTSYTTEFRQYDPRIGRWLSLDPLMAQFPHTSPYVAYADNPILFTDPYGLAPTNEGGGNTVDSGVNPEENLNSPNAAPVSDKTGFNAILNLLDPKSDPLDKANNYDKLKDANYYLSNEELTGFINNSSNSFIKSNKKELLQIKNINVVDGIMTIYTKEGEKVSLTGNDLNGKSHTLHISQGAKVDMTGLTIKSVTTTGKANANENAETVTLTYLKVTGSVKFTKLEGDYGVDLIKETFSTTIDTVENGDWDYKRVKVASTLNHGNIPIVGNSTSMGSNVEQETTW